ncbi:GntR family transcriptional regulator [Novosphingobium guangzhouense]|uniref:HTH gntR-type domain-containing protein n=1 Tax=Novosphingobium guangzhouense TaxID=1850347 RepID=A0A2K2G6J8_9SPHN|nr:GntR family transcriptional regulator [Novosphingobium guangzhouense]PNU06666.1 hypothetical protein A8V01_00260 [Novosphingobium guangzhouense]
MKKTSDDVYRRIRSGILSGHFAAGSFVPEDEFATYCGTSRTPVREAISRLVSEMLLQRSGTRRVFVPQWSDNQIEELFILRAGLEQHCAQRAARLITADQIAALQLHCDFIDGAISASDGPDIPAFVEGNRRFHSGILEAADSEPLDKLMRIVVSQVIIHRTAERYSLGDMEQSQTDHRDLIAAFSVKDSDWAGTIARNHILRAAHAYRVQALRKVRDCAEGAD